MPPKGKTKIYIVKNPNHLPKGIPLIHWHGQDWYEGEDFKVAEGMSIERLLQEGYIEEKGSA